MPDAAPAAVFLSYASQDAEAVQRIADALRAAGVEVWFDRNELVGGDAWDRKIRQQIRECALFVPVISATTQARGEGYFRLEWKLAVDRSHLMAPDQPFLLPVVIDDTPDAAARVADEFRAVQWTRLLGGETPEKFCARVKHLLSGSVVAGVADPGPASARPATNTATRTASRRIPPAVWISALAAAAALVAFLALRPKPDAAAGAAARPPSTEKNAPLTEARKLVTQARPLFESGDYVNREDIFLAEDLLKKAQALDSTDAAVWAAQAELSRQMIILGYERTSSRHDLLRQQGERAYKLAPDTTDSQIAYAGYLQWAGKDSAREAARMMEALVGREPDNHKAYRIMSMAWSYSGNIDQSMEAARRSNARAGGDPVALMMGAAQLQWWGRYAEIGPAIDQADGVRRTVRSLVLRVLVDLFWTGDRDAAAAALAKWPVWMPLEDRGAFVASQVWMWRREPDKAIAVLSPIARDAFYDTYYTGPKAVLLALAHEMAGGRPQAARDEWVNAKRVATRMVAEQPTLKRALVMKALAQAKLGETAEAEAVLRTLEQSDDLRNEFWSCAHPSALLRIALGHGDELAVKLDTEKMADIVADAFRAPRAALELNPAYDAVRNLPAFQQLLATAPAPAKKELAKPTFAAPAPAANEKSLVVLPLENLSPDPENAFFTEGMHAEIIATLQRSLPDLKVISRDSALTLKRGSASLAELARRVGVAYVLSGSVRRAGKLVRIQLELRRVADEALLWTFPKGDRELKDVMAVQSEVAEEVARVLLVRNAKGAYAGAEFSTKDPRAFDLFLQSGAKFDEALQGGADMFQRFDEAIVLAEQALAIDPTYMIAASMLSTEHLFYFGRIRGDLTAMQRHAAESKRWAETAVRLMPGGAGDGALALYYHAIEKNDARALTLAENAVRALPNESLHHNRLGLALAGLGRKDEALAAYRRSRDLDPLNRAVWENELKALAELRREAGFEKIATQALDRVALTPGFLDLRRFLLRGEIPQLTTRGPNAPGANSQWLMRARKFDEALARIESQLASARTDLTKLALQQDKSDALRSLRREEESIAAGRAAVELATALQTQPEFEPSVRDMRLARSYARAGRVEEALAAGRRYVEAVSAETQQQGRWQREITLAEIFALTRRPRECCELLAKLLRVPSGLTVPMLKVDPVWDNVRDDPAFKALLADPKNSAPL